MSIWGRYGLVNFTTPFSGCAYARTILHISPIFDTVYFHGLFSNNRYKAIFLGSLHIKK